MVRTHHLGFFGLRLSLLLLALLMMSVACVGLGDVGAAATHAGPGGLVGLALVGRFREIGLTDIERELTGKAAPEAAMEAAQKQAVARQ